MDSVYLETTILSYLAAKPSRDLLVAAHQQMTHEWWSIRRSSFECFISQVVLDELTGGDAEAVKRRLALVEGFPLLEATEEAERLTELIVSGGAIPLRAARDAAHIAIAAVHSIEFLLTWNCSHLANAQILRKVSAICTANGFDMPLVCTPEELMGDFHDER
jgi:hypothetical protein